MNKMQMMTQWNTRDVARAYSKLARKWDSKSKLIESKWGTTNRLRQVIQRMDWRGRSKLLDFGSGTGKVYRDLLSIGAPNLESVTMVDASIEMCRLSEARISPRLPARVINGDEYSREIAAHAPYDVITMMQVLHHLPTPERTLAELRKYASKDVVLIALTPGPLDQSNIFPYSPSDSIDSIGRQSTQAWEKIIKSSGWEIETIYDDRFTLGFQNMNNYVSFIRETGTIHKMSAYRIREEETEDDCADDNRERLLILGQYLTFYCRLGGKSYHVA